MKCIKGLLNTDSHLHGGKTVKETFSGCFNLLTKSMLACFMKLDPGWSHLTAPLLFNKNKRLGVSEEGECVVSCCFSRGFDLLARQEEQELDFGKDFCSWSWAKEGNREILKWATPKTGLYFSSKKRAPTWVKQGSDFASQQLPYQANNGRGCFGQL